jgi:hypothetical protein
MRTARKLIFGETWLLPFGLALVFLASLALRQAAPHGWAEYGGFALLAGVIVVALVSVGRSA